MSSVNPTAIAEMNISMLLMAQQMFQTPLEQLPLTSKLEVLHRVAENAINEFWELQKLPPQYADPEQERQALIEFSKTSYQRAERKNLLFWVRTATQHKFNDMLEEVAFPERNVWLDRYIKLYLSGKR